MTFRRRIVTALGGLMAGVVLFAASGCASTPKPEPTERAAGQVIFPDPEVSKLVDLVPEQTVKPLPTMRLADGLIPPTNRWFSGLVFGDDPMPVFPLPLSFALTDTGFEFGLPAVTSTPDSILGPHAAAISVDVGASSAVVRSYDDATVTIGLRDAAGDVIGSVVIAEGSPVVTFTPERPADITLTVPFSAAGDGVWSATVGDTEYGLVTSGGVDGDSLPLAEGEIASWIAVPHDGDLGVLAPLASPIRSSALSWAASDSVVTTTLTYGADATLVATMPHQRAGLDVTSTCGLGSYSTVYGAMELCSTATLSWTSPAIEPSSTIDLSAVSDDDKSVLRTQLTRDLPGIDALAADTYFGGKALYRLANLLEIAEQLDETDAATAIRERLVTAIEEWTDPAGCADRVERCFVYDPIGRGMVGLLPSFGSEEFNDHHFHYGYFLYAASVVARDDADVRDRIAPVVNLLAADLATSGDSTYFPERRNFDAYAGHSWASGFSPFGDGNNQESSSEAVSAWNGLALWADVTGNDDLATEARWMLGSEAASANAYWTNFDESDPVYEGFDHSITSLVWGGKRDYATWFSAEPNAKLAILLLPMSPVSEFLATDSGRILRNISAGAPNGFDVQFGDYLLMYLALADRDAALAAALKLPDERIDDGNSRTYMLAWIMSRTS